MHRVVGELIGRGRSALGKPGGLGALGFVLRTVIGEDTLVDDAIAASLGVVDAHDLLPAEVTRAVRRALETVPVDARIDAVGARDARETGGAVVGKRRHAGEVGAREGNRADGTQPVATAEGGLHDATAGISQGEPVALAVEAGNGRDTIRLGLFPVPQRVVTELNHRRVVRAEHQA